MKVESMSNGIWKNKIQGEKRPFIKNACIEKFRHSCQGPTAVNIEYVL